MTEQELEMWQDDIKLIGMLREEKERLKQENDFLRERENKLQLIEQMFQNGTVDLSELSKLVKEK